MKLITNRFEPELDYNICNDCKFRLIRKDTEFPCTQCQYNENHI